MTPAIKQQKQVNRGFTIVEMVVVISIFGILAGLVLARYKNFQANIDLENTAQDIALQIQQAENYAVAGRYPTLGTGQAAPVSNWRPSYGMYFSTLPADQKRFIFFFDTESLQPSDPSYNAVGVNGRGHLSDVSPFSLCSGSGTECLNIVTISNDVFIEKICEGLWNSTSCNGTGIPNVSIVFTRPFPDRIAVSLQGGTPTVRSIDLRIRAKSFITGNKRDIVVTPLGQIRLETVQ